MQKLLLVVLLMLCCAIHINGQTFQYSRGWTNGKRADNNQALRQMIPNLMPPQVLTANDLNNRERLIQHIIKNNPCDLRMALLANHNTKLNDDYSTSGAANDVIDEDTINRFKRELFN